MKKLWMFFGVSCYWLALPVLQRYVRHTHRSRVAVICNDEILVVKNWLGDGRWSIPGGGAKRGEDQLQAASRELREELKLDIATHKLMHLGSYGYHAHGMHFAYDLYGLRVAVKPEVSLQFPEIADAQWFDRQALKNQKLAPDVIAALAAWPE